MLAFEFGTRRHYVESIQEHTEASGNPLYVDVLKAHWLEEAQHVKADMLEVAQSARTLCPEELSVAFEQVVAIGGLVDAMFVGQVDQEIATLQRVTGPTLSAVETIALRDTLYDSLSTIIAGVALTDPSFAKVALELSTEGAAKLGIA